MSQPRRCAAVPHILVAPVDEDGAILRVVYDRAEPRATELEHLNVDRQ